MHGIEIRKQIDENNKRISEILSPCTFLLNNAVAELVIENKKLQNECEHEFDEDGFCIYCDKIKEGEE